MHTPTSGPMPVPSSSLSPAVVAVLDRLPDPPATFTAADVLDALAETRHGHADGTGNGPTLDVAGVLDALLSAELVSRAAGTSPARYVVHAEARPF